MRLESRSQTPQQLFEDIARQLFSSLIDPREVGTALREKVVVEGESLEQLMKELVVTLLDLVRLQHMVFSQFRVIGFKTPENSPYSLQAEAVGELLDPHRHSLSQDLAWLKCSDVQLRKEGEIYYAEIHLTQ